MDWQFLRMFQAIRSVAPYRGSYEPWLVAISVSIAILAAFVALSVSSRMVNAPSRRLRWAWAGAGALCMGGGIWAMHFIGMLAFSLPCGVSYDPLGTLLSMIPGIIASGVALHVIGRVSDPGLTRLLIGGVLIGAGIGAMHYSGMAAMEPDALIRYQPGLVAVSVVVAVVLAFVALEARFQLRRFVASDTTANLVAAIILGLAVSGMHYTAMQASVFYPLSGLHIATAIMPPSLLAALITVISVLIAAIALVSSAAGRQWELASGLSLEIGRRRALEQEAESGRACLQAIFDAVADAIITMDRAGHVKQWSSGAQRIFGYAPEEIVDADIAVLMPESQCSSVGGLLGQLGGERIVTGHELAAQRRDGSRFPAELALSEVRSGDEVFYTAIVRDITERKRAEAELVRAREQAEAANLAKSQFLATMSHEIRTPMNGVLGMAHLLTSTALNARQRRLVDNVVRSGQALLGIINDILDFAKIEAGKLELAELLFQPREAVAELADLFSGRCSNKGLEFVYFVSEDVPSHVIGDPVRLRQILINLVGNAVKFTEAGEVLVKIATLPGGPDEVILTFAVEDTGIGIAADQCSRIFESFHQVDSSMTRARGGSGLGLSITRQLVELMGGSIAVESELGRGSRFRFTAHLKAAPHVVGPQPRQHLPRTMRALVVDANATSAQAILLYLASWQIDAQVVATISEAEAALVGSGGAKGPFDVAILDVKGLGSRALEFAKTVRTASGRRQLELILLASFDTYMRDTSLEALGAAAILPKPVRPSELFNALVSIASDGTKRDSALRCTRGGPQAATPTFNARILVAEDNPVNQEVAVGMLEAMGCRAFSVSNGQLALDRIAQEHFDLILMDCEMPVMDGIEATLRIREIEAAPQSDTVAAKSRTPVIALTAHALNDVREKCFDAGMDAFLIKPFDDRQLAEALSRWLTPSRPDTRSDDDLEAAPAVAAPPQTTTSTQAATSAAIDMAVIDRLRTLGRPNEPSPLGRAVARFVDVGPALARTMQTNFENEDAEELARTAHSLKSSSGTLGATRLAKQCAQIETFARQSNLAALRPLIMDLDQEVAAAVQRLEAISGEIHAPA
ncbi:MAG TPA: MHYT domain-containing protein [Acetobacteraceae bacterium]|nr:MHYT domain-containing protein [Acetobacteraceae bacterium]